MTKKIVYLMLLLAMGTACSIKSENSPIAVSPDPKNQQNQIFQLKIGTAAAPETNEASLTEAQKSGGFFEWTWTAADESSLEFNSAMSALINCSVSPFAEAFTVLDSKSSQIEIKLPYTLAQVKDENYTMRLAISPNDCMGGSISFAVSKVETTATKPLDPIQPPQVTPLPPVQPQSPKQEEGFLGEEILSSSGGSFFIKEITSDIVYKDYIISTQTERRIYKSVSAGTSYCIPTQRPTLELLEIDVEGNILNRVSLDTARVIYPGKYYRLRFSMKNLKNCSYASESFNISYY